MATNALIVCLKKNKRFDGIPLLTILTGILTAVWAKH